VTVAAAAPRDARRCACSRRSPPPYFFVERYYVREWEAFVDALRRGEDPLVSMTDARAPLAIGLAAGRSLREGRSVRIAEITA
jgi:myo-inositol 2-dehydrogenase / D-chiro-inositol 1-dehydrogenase